MTHIGRNDPCNCGSGKKYKNCCLAKNQSKPALGLKGRKFTAKVLNNPKVEQEQMSTDKSIISPVDYNLLVERSFGEAFKKFPDHPPIPENSEQYLVKDNQEQDK